MTNFKDCNQKPSLENFYIEKTKHKRDYECKNCINENLKCIEYENYMKKSNLSNHKNDNIKETKMLRLVPLTRTLITLFGI